MLTRTLRHPTITSIARQCWGSASCATESRTAWKAITGRIVVSSKSSSSATRAATAPSSSKRPKALKSAKHFCRQQDLCSKYHKWPTNPRLCKITDHLTVGMTLLMCRRKQSRLSRCWDANQLVLSENGLETDIQRGRETDRRTKG